MYIYIYTYIYSYTPLVCHDSNIPGAWSVSKAGAEGASGQAERQGLGGVATWASVGDWATEADWLT